MISKIFSFLLICFLTISKGQAMSISDVGKVCTFSEVKAKVTYNGKPAIGAKVTQITKFKSAVENHTSTDEAGIFAFPATYEKSFKKLLPMEIVISQQILIDYNGETFEVWANGKMNTEENSELGGIPINLTCELTDAPETHRTAGSLVLTNCRWEKK